jgi:sugar phosphate isomerase/epimerase
MIDSRLGCSTISFRHLPLPQALATIAELGFAEIDLGALPGVCDHVPYVLDDAAVADVAATVAGSGLRVRSINGDIGDLNVVLDPDVRAERDRHLAMLVELAAATGARALVLPCGALDHQPVDTLDVDLDRVAAELVGAAHTAAVHGVELWAESLHFHRLCFNIERAQQLTSRLDKADDHVGVVMDFSHIVASGGDPVEFVERFGPRIAHVHIRDAVPGNINLSVGNGDVDFAVGLKALSHTGYAGHFSLELETRDITHDERPAAAARAGRYITELIK